MAISITWLVSGLERGAEISRLAYDSATCCSGRLILDRISVSYVNKYWHRGETER